jgi:hypothetical protein
MTIYLTYDEIRRLVREAMDQYVPVPAVVPVPDDEPTPDSSDDDDDELPPLAPASVELTLSIPSIPSFPEAVEDAFDSSCVDDDNDAL